MTAATLTRLIECDTMLAYVTTHYGTTIARLNDAQPEERGRP